MNSIRHKIIFVSALPLIIIAIILSSWYVATRVKDAESKLADKGRVLSEVIAKSVEYGVISGNTDYLDMLVDDALQQDDIIGVIVTDTTGTVVYEKRDRPAYLSVQGADVLRFETPIYRTQISVDDFETAANSPASVIGTVQLDVSTATLIIDKQRIIREGFVITLVLLFITVIAVLYYARSIISPFNDIIRDINKIRDGDVGYQLGDSSIHEITVLAGHINDMSNALKASRDAMQEQAENELFIERNKAAVTLQSIGEGVITTDTDCNITYMNPAAEALTGKTLKKTQGKAISEVFRIRHPDDGKLVTYPAERCTRFGEMISHDSHLLLVKEDDSELVVKDTATPIRDKAGNIIGMALIFHDFSNIKRMSDRLAYQASHDDLTGVYNRREFDSQLVEALNDARLRNAEHALCYLDLDQFKIINDTCGHIAGDILLKQVTYQVQAKIRRHDTLARLGGDEFGIIFYDCPIEKALELAEAVKSAISDFKYIWKEQTFDIGVSIGLVAITGSLDSHSEIMMHADSACYIAKDKGRNCVHVYQESDQDHIRRSDELQWYNRLITALDNRGFELYCQPISTFKASHAEAPDHHEILLRMTGPDGVILPNIFLPAAERYMLMPRVDRFVIDEFCRRLDDMPELAKYQFNINLSGQSLCNEEFLDFLLHSLQTTRSLNPRNLTFEITETAAISNIDKALHFMSTLIGQGCKFALDDFGTGISSFQYLNDLPVAYLKIDGSFVRNIHDNAYNMSIIRAITDIGHQMGLGIIAEYVENEAIMQKLEGCEIDYVQGYAISKPFPLVQLLNVK